MRCDEVTDDSNVPRSLELVDVESGAHWRSDDSLLWIARWMFDDQVADFLMEQGDIDQLYVLLDDMSRCSVSDWHSVILFESLCDMSSLQGDDFILYFILLHIKPL